MIAEVWKVQEKSHSYAYPLSDNGGVFFLRLLTLFRKLILKFRSTLPGSRSYSCLIMMLTTGTGPCSQVLMCVCSGVCVCVCVGVCVREIETE